MTQFYSRSSIRRVETPYRVVFFAWLFPMILAQLFLFVTVLLFFFGPWPWPIPNPLLLAVYLIAVQLSLLVGYLSLPPNCSKSNPVSFAFSIWVTKCCIIGTLVWIPIGFIQQSSEIRNGDNFLQVFIDASSNLADTYSNKGANLRGYGEGVAQRYEILPAAMTVMAFPLGLVYWNRMSAAWRICFVVSRIGEIGCWIISGTTKGVADSIILGIIMVVVSHSRVFLYIIKHWVRCALATSVGVGIVLGYFALSKLGGNYDQFDVDSSIGISVDYSNPFITVMPNWGKPLVILLSSYLTQGYYALGIALDLPFHWTFGFGNSKLAWGIASFFGLDGVNVASYPGQLETMGWDSSVRWHTLYLWLASDITFPGVILAMLMIGRMLSAAMSDTLRHANPYGVVVAYLLLQLVLYAPANNQVLGFEAPVIALVICTPLWILTRLRSCVASSRRLVSSA